MSATNQPFGLRPYRHAKGGQVRVETLVNGIVSGYATSIYAGDPVKLNASGYLVQTTSTGVCDGVFDGCFYVDSSGNERTSSFWPASTTATNIRAFFYRDPDIEYVIQADGSIPQLSTNNSGALGAVLNFSNLGNGSTLNGQSQVTASATVVYNTASSGPLRIIGFSDGLTDAPGDAFTVVQVIINNPAGFVPGNAV